MRGSRVDVRGRAQSVGAVTVRSVPVDLARLKKRSNSNLSPCSKCNCRSTKRRANSSKKTDWRRLLTSEDVLNSVGNDEVLVRDEAVDGLVAVLGHGSFLFTRALEFCD